MQRRHFLQACSAAVLASTSGFGLAQVRERLATAYGADGALEMIATPEGGTAACITFPLQK